MFDSVMQILAPHHCFGCGREGYVLCEHCNYDIVSEPFDGCIVCTRPARAGICADCRSVYAQAWCVALRHDVLEQIIDAYKFQRLRAASGVLADLLDKTVPTLPSDTVVVPVPTLPSHIRRRGYDHAQLIAKYFGKKRGLPVVSLLGRQTHTSQRGATRDKRIANAKTAFKITKPLTAKRYLIIDDIVTTGATLEYGAKMLKSAGAEEVSVAVIAKQPLDGMR